MSRVRGLFTLDIVLILAGSIVTAKDLPFQACFLPWTVGIPALLLAIALLVLDLFSSKSLILAET